MRPLRKALAVNSPGSAGRAPAANTVSKTRRVRRIPPWQAISTVSSPVKDLAPRKTVSTASSTRIPWRWTSPRMAIRGVNEEGNRPPADRRHRSATVKASLPERRRTASPPVPGGVATAAMVSEGFTKKLNLKRDHNCLRYSPHRAPGARSEPSRSCACGGNATSPARFPEAVRG